MHLVRPSPDSIPYAVRALKTVATTGHPMLPGARALLEAAQDLFAGRRFDLDALPTIAPEEVAGHVTDPAARAQLVHGMVTLSLVDGPPPVEQVAAIDRFAGALEVRDGSASTLLELADGRLAAFRFCFLRRAHLRAMGNQQLEKAGVLGTLREAATMLGWTEDPKLAARYEALGELPAGSVGRELHLYYVRNRFPWPGQRGAAPEAIVSHDVTHLLSGYGTDPVGETLVAAFTAGYQRDARCIFTPLVGLVMFSTGVHVIPNPNVPAQRVDAFAQPGVPARWFRAIERGGQMSVDLTTGFDLWSIASEPLEALRVRWNVVPE